MREDFEHWWDKEGQYSELCGKELCIIAWSNGEYKAQTKPISDEEIKAKWMPFYIGFRGDDYLIDEKGMFDFARAIEAKVRRDNA